MSPASVEEKKAPPQGSQITLIVLVLLLVLGLGALYFRMTGSLLWYVIGNIGFHTFLQSFERSQKFVKFTLPKVSRHTDNFYNMGVFLSFHKFWHKKNYFQKLPNIFYTTWRCKNILSIILFFGFHMSDMMFMKNLVSPWIVFLLHRDIWHTLSFRIWKQLF